ncbi:MAG: DUF3307 domain-containing protein [Pontiellaceae bacterium]|nr:DUF3307 domain-containing protein [Pontiellaceae bacterium]
MNKVFVVLVSAHFISDFLLQPNLHQRRKSSYSAILIHAAIVAFISYLFLQQWSSWFLPITVFLTHALIDRIKLRFRDTWRSFCADQVAHLLVLAFLVWSAEDRFSSFSGVGLQWMILVAGFVTAVQGAGFLVGKVSDQLLKENQLSVRINGLVNGGRMIGLLERALIFIFVMVGMPMGIGFLVAAKSVLRFGEARDDQRLAEYILIGTLLSFGLAIVAASITKRILTGV